MSNRIANYLPVSNRFATVYATAVMPACGSFAVLAIGQPSLNPTFGVTTHAEIHKIAAQTAQTQVAGKRRFRAYSSTRHLYN